MPSPPPSDTLRSLLLVALLACSVLAGPAVAAPDGAPTADPADRAEPADTAPSPGGPDEYSEHRGDVVTLTLSVGNATETTVALTAADGGYTANLSVTDADGDGEVTLRWNTYLAGHGDAFAATGEDAVTVRNETALDGRVPAGRYDVAVRADGESVDAATVELVAPAEPSVRSMVPVPGRDADLSSVEGIRASEANGTLRASGRFGLTDRVVLALTAPGIEGALAAQPGGNLSERLATLADSDGFALSVRENGSTVGVEAEPIELGFVGSGVEVLAAPAEDTYYLVYDVTAAPRREDQSYHWEIRDGDWFDVTVALTPASGLVDRRTSATLYGVAAVRWQVAPTEGVVPYVRPAADQAVVAPTNLPNGTAVTVVVEKPNGSTSRQNATVRGGPEGARIVARLDLAGVSAGGSVTVRYLLGDSVLPTEEWRDDDETTVDVAAEAYDVSVLDLERIAEGAIVRSLEVATTVPDGSIVVIHAENASGRYLGASGRLADGSYNRTIQVTRPVSGVERLVVVVHADTGDNGRYERDPAVVLNGTVVAASAEVQTPTPTPSPTATETATPTVTETDAGADETTAPSDATTGTTPGFGLLVALLAVVGVALWIGRP